MAPLSCPRCGNFARMELTGANPTAECRGCGYRFQPTTPSDKVLPVAQPVGAEDRLDVVEDDLEVVDRGRGREPLDVEPAYDDRPSRGKAIRSIRKRPRRRRRVRQEGEPFSFSLEDLLPIDLVLQVNIGVGIAILLNIVAVACWRSYLPMLGVLLGMSAVLFYIWGCMAYAEYKNYPMFIGLFGLLGPIGLIVLVCLPHRR